MPEPPRFSFHPLERRGLLLGLQAGQLVSMAAGAGAALWARGAIGGATGMLLSFLLLAGGAAGALWTRQGRPLAAWAVLGLAWLQRGRRASLNEAPLAGTALVGGVPAAARTGGASGGRPRLRPRRAGPPTLPAGVELLQHGAGPAVEGFGAVRDRPGCRWVAVLPVRGVSFSLLDPDDQAQRLDAWRTVLAAVARPGSPVTRLQWVQRSGPAGGLGGLYPGPAAPAAPTSAEGRARASYLRLVQEVAPVAPRHDTWLALAVGGDRRSRAGTGIDTLGRELRFLQGQLRQAGLEPGPALGRDELGALLGTGSMAGRESWSGLQVDGALFATYWVSEWPRVDVGPDFLVPLLMGHGRRMVSLLMAPVPPDRALREVRSARTADLADAQLRSRAGFLSSARRDREAEGVARRESELADGHAEYRFSAYVAVSGPDEDGLAAACSELEQAAQATRLELRRLYGRQAEAYTWTLPLGRGLR